MGRGHMFRSDKRLVEAEQKSGLLPPAPLASACPITAPTTQPPSTSALVTTTPLPLQLHFSACY